MEERGDEEEGAPANGWWRDHWTDLDPRRQFREDLLIAAGALAYLALLGWPLYDLVAGEGRAPRDLAIIGGLIGLLLASYAAMTNRMYGARRALIGIIGVCFIVLCWGFGPL